jgi:hypothetical protein
LKKETEKYKGKLMLICFNCDGVGHFSNKCPHKKNKINEEDDPKRKQIQKGKRNKNIFFKKSYYAKEDNSSSEEYEDEVNDSDTKMVMFIEVEDSDDEGSEE